MKKIKFLAILIAISMLPGIVKASDNGVVLVDSEVALEKCLRNGGYCTLTDNIVMTYTMGVHGETMLDLNGHTLAPSAELKVQGGLVVVERGGKLTINDSAGKGLITTGASNENVWGAIQLLEADSTGTDSAELIVNGGTLEGYYYGIVGNGSRHNTKVTVNGGIVKGINKEDSVGIFQPQMGDIIINNGIISGGSGIEIRSGNLTVNGGTVEGIAPVFTKTASGSGSTTNGVGIAIAQHTTKNPIKVTIRGGNINGKYALYEWNPQNNSQTDLDKVSISISGGDFRTVLPSGIAVYSQNFKKFISGGKFNTSVSEYLTDGAKLATKTLDTNNAENTSPNKNEKGWIIILIAGAVLVVGGSGIVVYRKKLA